MLDDQKARFLKMYGTSDAGIELLLTETETPAKVFAAEDSTALLRLLHILHTGTYAMSQVIPGLVETSANLGVIRTTDALVEIQFFPRSAIDQKIDEFRRMAQDYAALTGFAVKIGTQSPGWKENKDSKLAKIMAETFKEQNGSEMKVETIHAGLECGLIGEQYPGIDMISYGPTIKGAHSPDERLEIVTVQKFWDLTLEVLKNIPR